MKEIIKKRVMPLLLVVALVVSCLPTMVFAATYDSSTKVVTLENDETLNRDAIMDLFDISVRTAFQIKDSKGTVEFTSTATSHGGTWNPTHGEKYEIYQGTGVIIYKYDKLLCEFTVQRLQKSETAVNLNSGVVISYTGEIISDEAILEAVFESVTSGDNIVVSGYDSEVISISEKKEYSSLFNTYYDIPSIQDKGTYQVTVKYAGDDTYASSTATVTFTVADTRPATEIQIRDAQVSYDKFKSWNDDNWQAEVIKAMGIEVKSDGELVEGAEVTLVDDDNGKTLTKPTAGSTYTVKAKFTETDSYLASESQSAKLEIDAAPVVNTFKVQGDNVRVTVNGVVIEEEGVTVSTDDDAVIEISPEEGYYINSATVETDEAEYQATDEDGDGVFTYTVSGVESSTKGQTYTIEVSAVEKKTSVLNLKSNVEIDYKGKTITTKEILTAVFDNVKVDDKIQDDISAENVTMRSDLQKQVSWLGGTAFVSTSSKEITTTGTYKVTVSYAGDITRKAAADVAVEFKVVDNRAETVINWADPVIQENDLGSIEEDFAKIENVLEALNVSVVADEKNVDGAEVEIISITKGLKNYYSKGMEIMGSTILPVDYRPLDEVGAYTVTLSYAGDENNKPCEYETATLTIEDARPETQVNLKSEQAIAATVDDPVTEEEAFNLVFESVSLHGDTTSILDDYKYSEDKVTITTSVDKIPVDSITEAGTYLITVEFPETNTHKASEAMVQFTVTDGRNVTKVNYTENAQVPYNWETKAVTEEEILKTLNISVVDIETEEEISSDEYDVRFENNGKAITPDKMEIGGTYTAVVVFAGNYTQAPCSATIEFEVVDARYDTYIDIATSGVEVIYGEYTADELMTALLDGYYGVCIQDPVTNELIPVTGCELSFEKSDEEIESLNASEEAYTLTVVYAGDNVYKPATVEIEVIVNKADAKVSIDSQTVKYQKEGYNVSGLISTSPEGVENIQIAAGLSLGDEGTETIVYVNLPALVDTSTELGAYVQKIFNKLGDQTFSVSELKTQLETILSALEGLQDIPVIGSSVNLNTESIEALVSVLATIENMEGINNLSIKLTMGTDIVVENSGVYIVGAVTSDSNYNTAYSLGYFIITPDATEIELAFDIEDKNGIITRGALLSGDYSLGSHVVNDGSLTEDEYEAVSGLLNNLYIGVDANGNTYFASEPSADIGTYTQIAYIKDFGNQMYYATPIVRTYMVIADTATVEFIDEKGEVNNERLFTYDGEAKAMTARATNRKGKVLDDQYLTYTYIGIVGDAEGYYSSDAPVHAGVYTVIATYLDEDQTHVGMAVGTMIIQPAKAEVAVNDLTYIYDGNQVDVSSMITKTPEDAQMAVITAGIDVNGDFSENGWSAVYGVVNIDFPTRVDDILKGVVSPAYNEGITISTFINKLNEIKATLEEDDISTDAIDRVVSILEQLPDNTTLTFKEQSEVNPKNIGAYLVQGVICDPDYKAATDTGILIIAPEVTEAELRWNYNDTNGVITSPVLSQIDLGASAYVADVAREDITAQIQYLFVGVDAYGKQVFTTDTSELTNGVYTQIAYIEGEVSASMTVAAPIMRTIVIAPQTVTITFGEKNVFTYDGDGKSLPVVVTDMDKKEIKGERLDNLTVTYIGADPLTRDYNSTVEPTEAGAYTVIATYVEKDKNGELLYAGMNIGTMVIQDATADFEVVDTTVYHDGTEKFATINNEDGLTYISVVVDEANNVNVIFPEEWSVNTVYVDVAKGVDGVLNEIGQLPADVQETEIVQQLKAVLEGININTLSVNGTKPVDVGTYQITGIAFAKNYNVAVDKGTLTIEHDWEDIYTVDKGASCTVDGSKSIHCKDCDATKENTVISATGHQYGDWSIVISPSCDDKGSKERVCDACGFTETDDLDETGHTWESDYTVDKEATCTEDGSKSIHCAKCDVKKDSVVISVTGHQYGDWVVTKEATETETGEMTAVCNVCGDIVTKEIAKKQVDTDTPADDGKVDDNTGNPGDTTNGGTATDSESIDNGKTDTTQSKDKGTTDEGKLAATDSVDTGDSNNLILWISLIFASVVGVFAVFGVKKKKSHNK